jgi:peptidoglycan/LPS O-acetylase OafA/YrhL
MDRAYSEAHVTRKRLSEIDFLRAYAVVAVICSHSSTVVEMGITGYQAVLLFFLIFCVPPGQR